MAAIFIIVSLYLTASVLSLPVIPKGFGSAKHVVLIGIDGLGALHLDNSTHLLPNLARFYEEGSVALPGVARCEAISISPSNWAATITGMSPAQSGILDYSWKLGEDKKHSNYNNTEEIIKEEKINGITSVPSIVVKNSMSAVWEPPDPPDTHKLKPTKLPETMWEVAKKQDNSLKVAVVYSWPWIGQFVTDETVDFSYDCNGNDKECADKAIGFIKNNSPNISFIHFDSVDMAGHVHGFGSAQFYEKLKVVDGYIGEILDTLNATGILNQTLIMIMSDHGGYRNSHGYFNEENIFIPALFIGPCVKPNSKLTRYISIMDFVPTGLNALGLDCGREMRGWPVQEIY